LQNEIKSLKNINEENTHRIDEFDNQIFRLKQEIIEKDRQIIERDEKIKEIQLILEQNKESNEKLRKDLQKKNESIENNSTEIHLQKLTEDYEQRLKEQEIEYNIKLKAMAKEMNTQIDQKEQNYKQQLHDFIRRLSNL
jgi:predicted RNase H-like nuclease (RuvC/YqgF family)